MHLIVDSLKCSADNGFFAKGEADGMFANNLIILAQPLYFLRIIFMGYSQCHNCAYIHLLIATVDWL